MNPPVTFELDQGVGRITLARPATANAIDLTVAEAFRAAVDAAAGPDVRVVLLRGEGPRFCVGGDLRSFASAADPSAYLHALATMVEADLRRLSELAVPVVAAVHGAVAGAGLAFALNADLIVAARSATFRTAYASVGLTPDCGVAYLLPRAIGVQRSLDLALRGRVLSAEEACAWGLVTQVVDDVDLGTHADAVAARLAEGAGWALGQTKRLIRSSGGGTRAESAQDEVRTITGAVTTPDAQRLMREMLRP